MIKNIKILVIILSLFYSLNLRAQNDINWISWDQMIELRNKDSIKKKVFIDLYTPWCGWCKRMDLSTFKDPIIINYLNLNFMLLSLMEKLKTPSLLIIINSIILIHYMLKK